MFIEQEWNGCQVKLVPRDRTRNLIRELLFKHDIIPYFYGPISFDLGVIVPKKRISMIEMIKYEWVLSTSKDSKQIKADNGIMTFAKTKPFSYDRKDAKGTVTHYRSSLLHKNKIFRQIQAVDLVYLSTLEQYKVTMKFTDKQGNDSGDIIMAEFTLKDRDDFYLKVTSLFIGALFGAIFGGVLAFIVFIFSR